MEISLFPRQTEFFNKIFEMDSTGKLAIRTDTPTNEFAYFGGFGSGKSMVTMLATYYICMTYPNTEWLYCRMTYQQLGDSVIKQFNDLFCERGYKYKETKREIFFNNGSRIVFRAFDKDTKILSNMYDGATFCQLEEIKQELFLQVFGRCRLTNVPRNIYITEGNPSINWVFERYVKNKKPEHWVTSSTTFDNPFISNEYIITMIKNFPPEWVDRFIYGKWIGGDYKVLSCFTKENIVPEHTIDMKTIKSYKRMIGFDYGWIHDNGFIWGCVDFVGNVFIYDEHVENQMPIPEIVHTLKQHGNLPVVADYAIKKAERDGQSIWKILTTAPNNMQFYESNKDQETNILLSNTLFFQKRLFVSDKCKKLIEQMNNWHYKKPKVSDERVKLVPVDTDNDAIDAFLYLLQKLERYRSKNETESNMMQKAILKGSKSEQRNYF